MVVSGRNKFVADPVFFGADGVCGSEATKLAGVAFADVAGETELTPLVVSGTPPGTAKAKLQFGHTVTKAVAKHHGATSSFCLPAGIHLAQLTSEAAAWNLVPTTIPSVAEALELSITRLQLLRSHPIGGLLAVVAHWNCETGSFGSPILRVLASPAVATLGSFSVTERPGLNLQEVWDLTDPPFDQMPTTEHSCPLLVSAGGFSRGITNLTIQAYMEGTAPLFIPSGEEVAGIVSYDNSIFIRAIFLPTLAQMPIGMSWKLEGLTMELFEESITKIYSGLQNPYATFGAIIVMLRPLLVHWLAAAQMHTSLFAIKAIPFAALTDQFPSLITGAVPASIACATTFAPLSDMRYLYAWRLLIDKILSGTDDDDIKYLRIFLTRANSCLHNATYMGVNMGPDLSPNMGNHFKVEGGWPSLVDPLFDFSRTEVSSKIALSYQPITLSVHADRPAPASGVKLITASAASALRHKAATPRTSYIPIDKVQQPFIGKPLNIPVGGDITLPDHKTSPLRKPDGSPAADLFGPCIYSPPVNPHQRKTFYSPSKNKSLFAPKPATISLIPPKWSEINLWSIVSHVSRQACAPEYLLLCTLLIHGPPLIDINRPDYRVRHAFVEEKGEKHLLARQPGTLFLTRIMLPVFQAAAPGPIDAARLYIQASLDSRNEGYFAQFFSSSFFQASTLKALLQPASWNMEESFDPATGDSSNFQVYGFVRCLKHYSQHPALLPYNGFTCLELRPLAQFVLYWFRSLDTPADFVTNEIAHFDQSLLGTRLTYLAKLLERHQVQTLWAMNSKDPTYIWFQSLRSLLYLFQRLTTASMWKLNSGFVSGYPVNICPYTQDSQHFLNLIQEWDADQLMTWGRDRLAGGSFFTAGTVIHSSHFQRGPERHPPPVPRDTPFPADKKPEPRQPAVKRPREVPTPDFVAAQPLFELAAPPKDNRGIVTIFTQASPQNAAKPALPNGQDGKSVLICFASSCCAPFNVCNLAACHAGQARRVRKNGPAPTAFSHVDLAVEPWASKPETFWAHIVAWLKLPGVSLTVRPSAFLKAKTGSAAW
jgi:hypothetical protein